jgi:hypothetical protein
MWNVRRLCDHILWMDQGRVRAYGPATEMAERYLREVNLEAISNENAALQSHRRGTGEIRVTAVRLLDGAERETKTVCSGEALTIEADYHASQVVRQPLFQISVVDVDTGFTVCTASSLPAEIPVADGPGSIRCTFQALPLKPRHYIVRLAIFDGLKTIEYDAVTAGPRFIVTTAPGESDVYADEDDGFVTLPCAFAYAARTSVLARD